MFAFYADEQMKTAVVQPFPVTYSGVQNKNVLLYFGSPNANETLVPESSSGVNEVILTPKGLLEKWQGEKYYNVGDIVEPLTINGAMYRCTIAGSAGKDEPSWNVTSGGATISGSASFINAGPRFVPEGIKMALSEDGLSSANAGGSLSLGKKVVGGVALAVHFQLSNASDALRNDSSDPCVGIDINDCIVTTSS